MGRCMVCLVNISDNEVVCVKKACRMALKEFDRFDRVRNTQNNDLSRGEDTNNGRTKNTLEQL